MKISCSKELRSKILKRLTKARESVKVRLKFESAIEIDFDYLLDLYNKQKGRCYYTGVKMSLDSHSKNALSLERKNPNIGYVKENVVWCSWTVNCMKRDHGEKDFIKLCKLIVKNAQNKRNIK